MTTYISVQIDERDVVDAFIGKRNTDLTRFAREFAERDTQRAANLWFDLTEALLGQAAVYCASCKHFQPDGSWYEDDDGWRCHDCCELILHPDGSLVNDPLGWE